MPGAHPRSPGDLDIPPSRDWSFFHGAFATGKNNLTTCRPGLVGANAAFSVLSPRFRMQLRAILTPRIDSERFRIYLTVRTSILT